MLMKKGIITAILVAWASVIGFSATSESTDAAVKAFATGGCVNPESVAVMIIDLVSDKEAGAWNADKPLIPASVMKCVTTASLLEKLGKDWKYETRVYLTGKIDEGVVEGNILVEASGDPSLNTIHAPGSKDLVTEIVDALRAEGIHTIRGDIKIDESRFKGPAINPGWMQADLPHSYGTGTHGFNFEDNASGNKSVANPSGVFSRRLTAAMSKAGIGMQKEAMADGRRMLLGVHRSEPLSEIMMSCMMRSDNQFAEGLLRTLSAESGKDGSIAAGARLEGDYWKRKGLKTDGVIIKDGSGLSRENRLTARFLAGVLKDKSVDPWYASFFPLAGQEGTLKRFLAGTPLEGYVAMKTGSMRGIQCYAGYKVNDDYVPTHVIVVMINDMADRASAREGVKSMLERIFLNDDNN